MALSCALPVTYKSSTSSATKPLTSFIDLYEHMAIKLEEPSPSTSGSPYDDTSSSEYEHDIAHEYKHALVKTEMEDDDSRDMDELTSWTKKHPEHWTKDEVLDWVYFVVDKMDLDGSKVCGEAYQSICGSKLCRMTRQDFLSADPFYGSKLYDVFRDLINGATIREPKSIDQSCSTTLESINQSHRFQRIPQQHGGASVNNNNSNNNNNNNNFNNSSGNSKNATTTSSNSNNNNKNNNNNNVSSVRGRKDAQSGFDLDFRSNSNSPNLLVYNHDDNDVKVDLGTLGVYPISTDFEFLAAARDDGVFPCPSSSSSSTTAPASSLSLTSSSSTSASFSSLPSAPFSFFNSVSDNRHHLHHHHHHYHHHNSNSFNNNNSNSNNNNNNNNSSQSGCYFNGQQKQPQQRQHLLPSPQHPQQQNYHSLQPISASSLPQLSPIIQSLPSLQQTYHHDNQTAGFNGGIGSGSNHTADQIKQYSVHTPSTTYSSFVSPTSSTAASPSHSAPLSSSSSSSSSPPPSSSPSLEMSMSSANISSSSTPTPSSFSSKFSAIQTTCDSVMKSSTLASSLSSTRLSIPSSSLSSSSSSAAVSVSTLSSVSTSSLFSSSVVDISSSELMEVTDSDYISDDDLFVQIPDDVTMKTTPSTSKNVTNASSSLDRKRAGRKNKPSQSNKGNHLWEFVRDLLQDPAYNPRLLKWEDKENGVFRFVQSEAVAQLWGEKKKNPMMTYEKLSRAMRFCRSSGYFDNVPKNGKFPKKLCFMFGAKAHGWRS